MNSDAGVLAYVYTGADGEWQTQFARPASAPLHSLGVTWVFAERAEPPLTPARMERLYEEETPAGRLVLQVNRTGCRVRETRLDGALRLIVRVGDYREDEIVLTARVQGGNGRGHELSADASACVVSEALPDGLRVVVPVERKRLSPAFPDFYITLTLAWASE